MKPIIRITVMISIVLLIITGCRSGDIQEDTLYVVDKEEQENIEVMLGEGNLITEGLDPFAQYASKSEPYKDFYPLLNQRISKGHKLCSLTVSEDGKTLFGMESLSDKKIWDMQSWMAGSTNEGLVIKGLPKVKVNLFKVDLEKEEMKNLVENVDFISLVKWNEDRSKVAFLSGKQIFVYDVKEDKLLFKDYRNNSNSLYFGWSPDGNKIYTEDSNLINDSIYYVDAEKVVRAYETKERLYYKGRLDDDYYFATLQEIDERKLKYENNTPEYQTVVVDAEGNVIKKLPGGRFRGDYKKSMIYVGESGFGLYYYPDVQKTEDPIKLTEEYIYDAKFVADGKIAFITEDKKNIEENYFVLHMKDIQDKYIKDVSFTILGGQFLVTESGEYGTIQGDDLENVSFSDYDSLDNELYYKNRQLPLSEYGMYNDMIKTIRGAADIYLAYEINGEKDYESLKKYFVDTPEYGQAAYTDMEVTFRGSTYKKRRDYQYAISIYVDKIDIYDHGNRASVKAYGGVSNSFGTGMGMGSAFEMVKKDGRWYVTGLSTFPNSSKAKTVREKVLKYMEEVKLGRLFDGELKGKELELVQIQFWRMSEPHLSPDIDSANYCKVYFKVKNDGEDVLYKMVLDQKNYKDWKPIKLDKERLIGL
ncbi:MAG: hypothetical protein ACOYVK_21100 [Bacillota bacterium]